MKPKPVTQEEILQWEQRVDEGMSANQIAKLFGRQHCTILKYISVPDNVSKKCQGQKGTRHPKYLGKTDEEVKTLKNRLKREWQHKYQHTNLQGKTTSLFQSAKARSKEIRVSFDLTMDFLFDLYKKQNGRCALTGIVFKFEPPSEYKINPFAMSIDRIDSNGGYTKDNVRLVLASVNLALSEFGEDHFKVIAKAYLDRLLAEEKQNDKVPTETS